MYVKQNMQAVGQNPDSMPSNAENQFANDYGKLDFD